GLLEDLRRRPPLPEDWKIVRALPAPQGDLASLTYVGDRLWVHDKTKGEIVGVSRKDGKVERRLKPPWPAANLGNVSGKLGVVRVQRDKSGRRTETLWVTDPDQVGPLKEIPMSRWRTADGPWHVLDFYGGPKVIGKNRGRDGWGSAPFGEHTTGVTWDRKELWVLDNAAKRICSIERSADSTLGPLDLGDPGFIRTWLVCGPFPSPELSEAQLAKVIAARKEEPYAKHLRGGHHVDYLGGEAAARPTDGDVIKRSDGVAVKWKPYESLEDVIRLHEVFGEDISRRPLVVYACTSIYRAEAGKALLALGSDDSAKVWLNGKLVHDAYVARPITVDEDVVPVEFHAGQNHLLIKIENVLGGGGFVVRPVQRLPSGELEGLPPEKSQTREKPVAGTIRTWLVCGPFPSPELSKDARAKLLAARKDDDSAKYLRGGHHVDYLKEAGGEAAARPTAGQVVKLPDGKTVTWTSYDSPTGHVLLHNLFGAAGWEPMVAYAYTTVDCAKAGK
ncbi:unnamed protein product, partial [marine sediment metagenome]